jgi:hypothetical protein
MYNFGDVKTAAVSIDDDFLARPPGGGLADSKALTCELISRNSG